MDLKLYALLMKKIKSSSSAGKDGKNGTTFTPEVSEEGLLSWTNDGDLPNPKSVNIKGADGKNGENGAVGAAGKNGVTFTPNVSDEGVLSWTNDGGEEVGNPQPVNIKGKDGVNGQNGDKGADGENGATFTPNVTEDGLLSWTNDKSLPNPTSINIKGADGQNGSNGVAGKDGVSIIGITFNEQHHLICKMSNDTDIDAGVLAVLPAVTAADNGKILKVVDGEWALATDSNDDVVSVLKVETEE